VAVPAVDPALAPMPWFFDHRHPTVDDLRATARKRIPAFVFDFLGGGCNDDVNLRRNVEDFRSVELMPR